MKNTLIVILLLVVGYMLWTMMGNPVPVLPQSQPYQFNTQPSVSQPVVHTPVYQAQPAIPVYPTGEPIIVTVVSTPTMPHPTATVANNAIDQLTLHDYGLPVTSPLSLDEIALCRTIFESGLKDTMKPEQKNICEVSIAHVDGQK